MRISTRISLTFLFVSAVGFYFLVDWIVRDLTPRYRESTEETLVDLVTVLAAQLSVTSKDGIINAELLRTALNEALHRRFQAQIYNFEKTSVDLRVYVTNEKGIVIFDSRNGQDEGKDYTEWRDVARTLEGQYGARTSRDDPDVPLSTMYVAAPILSDQRIIGVVSVGKPTLTANLLVEAAKWNFIKAAILVFGAVILLAALLSIMVTRPIRNLTEYARAIRDGERQTLPALGSGEIGMLGSAFEEMKEALEGKQYVEKYVQTLTHEVKSPLSGIKGAVELLKEDLPADKRTQFLGNIERETNRLQSLVEKLLGLSGLQRRKFLAQTEAIDLAALARECVDEQQPQAEAKGITFRISGAQDLSVSGERFWVKEAVANLLQNALDFSSHGTSIEIEIEKSTESAVVRVKDQGSGVPAWALDKVFDQFYSLSRPDSGKKSTGLGLTLVREVMDLHQGSVTLENRPAGGVEAVLKFPLKTTA